MMDNSGIQIIRVLVLSFMTTCICKAEDITIHYKGATAKVTQKVKDSVNVSVEGANVNIESLYKDHKLTLKLTGNSDDGQLNLKTAGKAKITLDGLTLTSQEGAPIYLKNKKKAEVSVAKGTNNSLTITACNDTANHKAAAIWAKDKLLLSGKGVLNVASTGDGCRGIKAKKDITIEELTLNVTTSGNNLGEKPFSFGGPGGPPDFDGEMPDFGGFPPFGNDSIKPGDFPTPPFGGPPPFVNDSLRRDGPPEFDGELPDFGGGFGGKHKYVAATKGVASKGTITINSGNVTVRTNTAGAEGIEGKKGILFGGGNVDVLATDDAINANATIEFNGANVIARSMGNDAVDANPEGGFFPPFGGNSTQKIEPAIIIRGGTVYAWSQVGPPEEGLDSDMAPLAIEGGTIFTVGGFIGDMPSVPTNETAKQPTVLITGVNIVKDEPVYINDEKGKPLFTVTIPFSLRGSATLISNPAFKQGSTYTLKTKGYEKTFTLSESFTAFNEKKS
jgi:hypothetical protein